MACGYPAFMTIRAAAITAPVISHRQTVGYGSRFGPAGRCGQPRHLSVRRQVHPDCRARDPLPLARAGALARAQQRKSAGKSASIALAGGQRMTTDRIYFAYMAFIGAAAGAILASAPARAGLRPQAVFLDPDRGRPVRRRALPARAQRAVDHAGDAGAADRLCHRHRADGGDPARRRHAGQVFLRGRAAPPFPAHGDRGKTVRLPPRPLHPHMRDRSICRSSPRKRGPSSLQSLDSRVRGNEGSMWHRRWIISDVRTARRHDPPPPRQGRGARPHQGRAWPRRGRVRAARSISSTSNGRATGSPSASRRWASARPASSTSTRARCGSRSRCRGCLAKFAAAAQRVIGQKGRLMLEKK